MLIDKGKSYCIKTIKKLSLLWFNHLLIYLNYQITYMFLKMVPVLECWNY